MNPWKIIGWIVLVGMLLSLTFCGLVCVRVAADMDGPKANGASPNSSAASPDYRVEVLSLSCEERGNMTKVGVTVRNSGGLEIPFAKAFFRVGTQSEDSYFSPSTVPAGSLASADSYVRSPGDCRLLMIQDGKGNQVRLSSPPE